MLNKNINIGNFKMATKTEEKMYHKKISTIQIFISLWFCSTELFLKFFIVTAGQEDQVPFCIAIEWMRNPTLLQLSQHFHIGTAKIRK